MIVVVSLISIVLFLVAFWSVRVIPIAAGVLSTAQGVIHVVRDPTLDDEVREKAVQRASVQLFGAFFSILLRSIAALAAAVAPIYLADFMDLAPRMEVMVFLARWDVIIGATVIICGVYYAVARLWPR